MITTGTGAAVAVDPVSAAGTAVASPSVPAPAPGNVGVQLLDVPAATQADPRARQYIVDLLKPGTVIHRRVEVSNTTTGPLRVSFYPAAATITGGVFTGAPAQTGNELSRWTTVHNATLIIPAGGVVTEAVTIAIPPDAAPGERYGVLWAQTQHAAGDINLINRVGIRMYIDVGGLNPTAADFTITSITAGRDHTGRPLVHAQVHNTGGRAVDLSGILVLDAVGSSVHAGPYPVLLGTTLAPGQTEPVTIALPADINPGPWQTTLQLASGLIHHTATATITFPAAGHTAQPAPATQPPTNTGTSVHGVTIIIFAIIAAAVLFLLAMLITSIRRRRTRQRTLNATQPGSSNDQPA